MANSSFKRIELVPATELRNVDVPLLQCQQTSEQQNDPSSSLQGAFYPVRSLEQAPKRFFMSYSHCSMKCFIAQNIMSNIELSCAIDDKTESATCTLGFSHKSPDLSKQFTQKCNETVRSCKKSAKDFFSQLLGYGAIYSTTFLSSEEIVWERAWSMSQKRLVKSSFV